MQSLTVAVGDQDPNFAALWFGKIGGYFQKNGVDVKIAIPGANTANEVVAGKADLAEYGVPSAFTPVKNGMPMSLVFADQDAYVSEFMAAVPKVHSVSECKTVATWPLGSSAYGWAVLNKQIFGAHYSIRSYPDEPTQLAALSAGAADCDSSNLTLLTPAINAGKVHLIVDGRKKDTLPSSAPPTFDVLAFWGVRSNLQKKREAVVDFLRGYHQAWMAMKKMTPAQVAHTLYSDSSWHTFKESDIASAYANELQFSLPNNGYISPATYAATANFVKLAGLAFVDPKTDDKYSYGNVVDMSYYDQAIGKPAQ